MTRWWQRSRSALPWLAVGVGAIAAGVVTILVVRDRAGDGPGAADAATPPSTTISTAGLSTVAPIPLPEPCSTDPGSLAVWTAGVRIDTARGTADAVLRFENLTTATCELDLTDPTVRVDRVEPSVRLEPGGWGELLVGTRSECDRFAPLRSVVLELNGDERTVPTAALIACEHTLLEFLPAERPVDPCLATDLTTAVVLAGLVVRNDSARPCVLGELISIDLPFGPAAPLTEMAQTRPGAAIVGPVGPDITRLGQGDVAYFQTLGDPIVDCTFSVQPAKLNFAEVGVNAEFPICTFVRLGPGRPYYGAPGGPFADAVFVDESNADLDAWLAELDPFRLS